MNITNKELKRRILDISYNKKLSHLSSCLTAVDIIDEIYSEKKKDEPFVLSAGHAGLALYVVIEKYGGKNAEDIFDHHGVHPDRCSECGLYASTGSLGHGLPIAVGMALADKTRRVYCLVSDGECAEGSIWEALRITEEQKLENLRIYVNANGYGAYRSIDSSDLHYKLKSYAPTVNLQVWHTDNHLPFLEGLKGHYHVMSEADYQLGMNKIG